jgi:hypothetical protein
MYYKLIVYFIFLAPISYSLKHQKDKCLFLF